LNKNKVYPILQAILASILFGASAPLSKILLGQIEPVPLASFLYLGSGLGLMLFQILNLARKKQGFNEASLKKNDIPWLLGAIIAGGIAAPIILMASLKITPASTASLLLNFEGAATTFIAFLFFKESIGKQILGAILCITFASILLSWDFSNQWGLSIGALGIICACICWGVDNNFTRNISAKNPFTIVTIKGLAAGSFSLILSLTFNIPIPNLRVILLAMLLGFFCYGLSIVLFVFALRELGSVRTSSLFGTAPFVGAILSFIILGDIPNIMFYISLPIMIIGAALLLKENHSHTHTHELLEHEHKHNHTDGHHNHSHTSEPPISKNGYHTHMHLHEPLQHPHPHSPDIHHRHKH
jgi:drug/metabolite transporter (DMT)-like permease